MRTRRQVIAEAVAEEEKRKGSTLAAVIARYLAERPRFNKNGRPMATEYLEELKRALTRDVANSALGEQPLDEITSRDIRSLVNRIAATSPGHANHVLSYVRTMLRWAVVEELVERNPADGIAAPAPKVKGHRVLTDDEIKLFWAACDKVQWPFGPMFQLLLLTAARRDEMADSTWAEFDMEKREWRIPPPRTKKNWLGHIVHLAPLTLEIIATLPRMAGGPKGFVFTTGRTGGARPISGFSHAQAKVLALMRQENPAFDHYRLHDLRRSAATGMAALGVAEHVVDKMLNHSSGKISEVAAIYNLYKYLPERQAALELWAEHITKLVGRNVITLPARGAEGA